jgi:hypothetical protein
MPLKIRITLLALLIVIAGCAKAPPRTRPEPPPLEPPPPPPRVVAPIAVPETPPATSPAGDAARAPARQPPARAETPPRKETGKVETPAKQDPGGEAKPATPPDAPRTTLETKLPAPPKQVEQTIRNQIDKAKADLRKVAWETLNADGQSQYNTVKRFTEQAEEALKEGNLIYAQTLADKAATLAAELAGR